MAGVRCTVYKVFYLTTCISVLTISGGVLSVLSDSTCTFDVELEFACLSG